MRIPESFFPVRPGAIFARRVREVRSDKRPAISQGALAQQIALLFGIEDDPMTVNSLRVAVNRLEGGKRVPTIDDLFLFAIALGVAPNDLLGEAPWQPTSEERIASLERRMDRLENVSSENRS